MARSSPSLGTLLESFFIQRLTQQRQASPATISAYKDAIRLLLLFVASRLDRAVDLLTIYDLDYDTVLAFLDSLERDRGNSPRTRNARLVAIHSFFRYVAFCDPAAVALVQRVLSIPPKRVVKRVLGHLDPTEVSALLAAPDRRTVIGRRDHVILFFLLRTGARASETVGVDAAHLCLDGARRVVLWGKGSKERVVPLGTELATALRDLIRERGIDPRSNSPVFVDDRGRRLTRFGLTHVVRRSVDEASKSMPALAKRHISPHTFRHTAAMTLLQAGVDLTVIRSWLGHVDIQTTHQYLEADVEAKRRALEAAGVAPSTGGARYEPPSAILALLER